MGNTTGTLAAVLISISITITMSIPAQGESPKKTSALSQVPERIDSPNEKSIYDQQMSGAALPDGFGTSLPAGVTADDIVRLLLPQANTSLSTLVGMKAWPYSENTYVAFACIAPNQVTKDRALKYNNGKPICSPWQVEAKPGSKPGESEPAGDYLMAVGFVQKATDGRLSLASTVVSWSGIEGSPLGTTWNHSNLFGPEGINHWKDKESEEMKDEMFYPSQIYKLDFAKYAISDSTIAFGIRSGMTESYSGGGASFEVLTLFAVVDDKLRVIFSQPISYFKDIAGDWNEDGTRNHEIYDGENIVIVSSEKENGYAKLIVKSKKKSWRKSFHWDRNSLSYVVDRKAATLEEAFAGFRKCEFKDFYYAPWDPQEKAHPYLAERGLTPYKEDNGLYYFKVKDSLFGLPVSEIIIPGTWNLHAIVFDVPLAKAQKALKRQFGSVFAPSTQSAEGKAPALEAVVDNPSRSSLYCNEVEGGK